MAWTKRQIIDQAYEEIGLAAYAFDLQPEEYQSALRSLDAMMGTWQAKNILFAYPLPDSPATSDLDDNAGQLDASTAALYLNLAVRLAPQAGKVSSVETRVAAKDALSALMIASTRPPVKQINNKAIPAGAGNKRSWGTYDPFLPEPKQPVDP